MKTNLLTLIFFAVASILYSCSKESGNNTSPTTSSENAAPLTNAQRRIIIANCSGHSGCHSSAKLLTVVSLQDANILMRTTIDPDHNLNICERNKLQLWFNSEGNQ